MFIQEITSPIPPLNVSYVNSLNRIANEPDYSFISLATALIKPRVSDYRGVQGLYWHCGGYADIIDQIRTKNEERQQLDEDVWKNIPAFYYYLCPLSDHEVNSIKTAAKECGLTELTNIEMFGNQQLGISNYAVFINEKTNAAFVYVGKGLMSLYHLTLAFMPLLYPGIFKDQPLNPQEVEVLRTLTNKTPDNFRQKLSDMLMYLKPDLLRMQLTQCFRGYRDQKANAVLVDINAVDRRINENLSAYRSLVAQKEDLVIRYEGLKAQNNEEAAKEDQEIIDYLCHNQHVHSVDYSNGDLTFVADTLLTNFDLAKWTNAVSRDSIFDGYRIGESSPFHNKNNRKKLLSSIFNADPALFVRMKGDITLRLNRQDINVPISQRKSEEQADLEDFIINTHFKLHGCPGRNRDIIVSYLREGDILSAIECFIAAVGAINIGETDLTFRPFVQELLTSEKKVLVNKDGEAMTPEEALLWLAKHEQ